MMCIAPGQLDKQVRYGDSLQKEEGNQIPVPWLLQRERGGLAPPARVQMEESP